MAGIKKKAGIFCLRNMENQRRYIGASRNIEFAKKNLLARLADGSHKNARLQMAWKDGGFSFDVVELLPEDASERLSELLAARRQFWIRHFRSDHVRHGYNLEMLKRSWEERREGRENEPSSRHIRELLKPVVSRLDPAIDTAEDRLRHLHGLLDSPDGRALLSYFSSNRYIESQLKGKNDLLCENDYALLGLSKIADYLVFSEQTNNSLEHEYGIRKASSVINASYSGKKELLAGGGADIDVLTKPSDGKMTGRTGASDKQKLFKAEAAQKVGKADIANHRFLKNIDDELVRLSERLGFGLSAERRLERQQGIREHYGKTGLYRLKRMYGDLKKDSVIIKDQLCGTIYFKRIVKSAAKIDYDADTGYFTGYRSGDYVLVSENKLDFSNEKHIFHLLFYYGELHKAFHSKVNSDMYHLLLYIDELIARTAFEPYIEKLLVMKREGYDGEEIARTIQKLYGINWDKSKISRLFNRNIPRMLAETHRLSREEWLYTYKAKGIYKKCSKCRQNKLANESHFGKKADSKDGLHTICRHCR